MELSHGLFFYFIFLLFPHAYSCSHVLGVACVQLLLSDPSSDRQSHSEEGRRGDRGPGPRLLAETSSRRRGLGRQRRVSSHVSQTPKEHPQSSDVTDLYCFNVFFFLLRNR